MTSRTPSRYRSVWLAIIAMLMAALVVSVPLPHARGAAQEVEWSVAPADGDFGAGRSSFRYSVDPGASFTDAIVVRNYSAITLDLQVFPLDGIVTDSGTLGLPPSGTPSTQIGAWVTADKAEVSIPAGGEETVTFQVNVPADVAPGDYVGGLVTSRTAPGANQVNIESRLASRIVVSVAGDAAVGTQIDSVEVVDVDGAWIPFTPVKGTLRYTVTNTGNVLTRVNTNNSITLGSVRDVAAGGTGDPEAANSVELMPGGTGVFEQEISVWPAFFHKASVEITPEALTGEIGESVSASATVWVIPWGSLGAIVLIAAGVVVGVRVHRSNKAKEAELAAHKERLLNADDDAQTIRE
ncbi:hypothetical protein [Trueperella bialowiezensis]|uniref:DUF916 domain-containing protein n=1 Tax=Trueperella bialowiezensis TaxID=312285 RepID=A0A3S4VTE8_9ACTO|nr:hypothetical protein [Trueperella bialowiezensis]VEI13317.1 Uncharacterised protein [Trueperella bialowiezensis]